MRLWPVRLEDALDDGTPVVLRALRRRDRREWLAVRRHSREWLKPWEPTLARPGQTTKPYAAWLRHLDREARAGRVLPWAVEVDGRLVGGVTLSHIFEGAMWGATAGYWCAPTHAGRGITPLAVAMACDHAMTVRGIHRIEVNIRPGNFASLAVARKLGLRDEGVRRRFLHIDGDWRDHRTFALTAEEVGPAGFVARLRSGEYETNPTTHPHS